MEAMPLFFLSSISSKILSISFRFTTCKSSWSEFLRNFRDVFKFWSQLSKFKANLKYGCSNSYPFFHLLNIFKIQFLKRVLKLVSRLEEWMEIICVVTKGGTELLNFSINYYLWTFFLIISTLRRTFFSMSVAFLGWRPQKLSPNNSLTSTQSESVKIQISVVMLEVRICLSIQFLFNFLKF